MTMAARNDVRVRGRLTKPRVCRHTSDRARCTICSSDVGPRPDCDMRYALVRKVGKSLVGADLRVHAARVTIKQHRIWHKSPQDPSEQALSFGPHRQMKKTTMSRAMLSMRYRLQDAGVLWPCERRPRIRDIVRVNLDAKAVPQSRCVGVICSP
jgi:hypothetical protein